MAARKPFVMQHAMRHYPEQQRYALLMPISGSKPLGPLWRYWTITQRLCSSATVWRMESFTLIGHAFRHRFGAG
jgi:hypothetical protein